MSALPMKKLGRVVGPTSLCRSCAACLLALNLFAGLVLFQTKLMTWGVGGQQVDFHPGGDGSNVTNKSETLLAKPSEARLPASEISSWTTVTSREPSSLGNCADESMQILSEISATLRAHSADHIILEDVPEARTSNVIIKLTDDQKSPYVVLPNVFVASHTAGEEITIATQSSIHYLNQIVMLAERWRAPISMAVWAPGYDFHTAISIIAHLRCCFPLVEKLVSFSFVYPTVHQPIYASMESLPKLPKECPKLSDITLGKWNPWEPRHTYTLEQRLLYPVNAARNAARSAVTTNLLLTMDVELLPSANLATDFVEFIRRTNPSWLGIDSADSRQVDGESATTEEEAKTAMTDILLNSDDTFHANARKVVYVIPAFEVKHGIPRPSNKSELLKLLARKEAIPFHSKRCKPCHVIPDFENWKKAGATTNKNSGTGNKTSWDSLLSVFYSIKWVATVWEPVYISQTNVPLYDERFVGYGSNKIQQAYELCRADYDFDILDRAFVSHQGILKFTKQEHREKGRIISQNGRNLRQFMREMDKKYNETTAKTCNHSRSKLAGVKEATEGKVELISG